MGRGSRKSHTVMIAFSPARRSLPPCSQPSRTSPSGGRQAAAILDRRSTRRRNRTAVGTEKWLRRGRTEKCAVRQVSCQLFVFKLNEGADGVSIAICAQKHRVQPSISLHRLIRGSTDACDDVAPL